MLLDARHRQTLATANGERKGLLNHPGGEITLPLREKPPRRPAGGTHALRTHPAWPGSPRPQNKANIYGDLTFKRK